MIESTLTPGAAAPLLPVFGAVEPELAVDFAALLWVVTTATSGEHHRRDQYQHPCYQLHPSHRSPPPAGRSLTAFGHAGRAPSRRVTRMEHWTLERTGRGRPRHVHKPAAQPHVDGRDERARSAWQSKWRPIPSTRSSCSPAVSTAISSPTPTSTTSPGWAAANRSRVIRVPGSRVRATGGDAPAGGCSSRRAGVGRWWELSLACTLRVPTSAPTSVSPRVAVGIIPGRQGGTQRLPRLIGAGRAAELVLSARIIDRGRSTAHRSRRGRPPHGRLRRRSARVGATDGDQTPAHVVPRRSVR